jgi:hypothetical protein
MHSVEFCEEGQSPALVSPRASILGEDGPSRTGVRESSPQIRLPPPLHVVTSTRSSAMGSSAGTRGSWMRHGGRLLRHSCENGWVTAHTPLSEAMFPESPHDSFRRNEWKRSNA